MTEENPGIYAKFMLEPVRMGFKSEEAGRDIHEMREFLTIVISGDNKTEIHREATDADRTRFASVYERFLRQEGDKAQMIGSGTALSAAPFLNAAQVKDLEHFNVFTVEALAKLSDAAATKFGMGARELIAKAAAFLKLADDSAYATKLAAEVERKDDQISDLQRQIRELAERFEAAGAGSPPPPPVTPAGRAPRAAS